MVLDRPQAVLPREGRRRGCRSPLRVHLEVIAIVISMGLLPKARADSDAANVSARASETGRSGRFVSWFRSDPAKQAAGPDIRHPGPDLANFPNSSFTLPRRAVYLETTPFNMASASDLGPMGYNWEVFVRVGIIDNIEARIYSGGVAVDDGSQPTNVGFLPVTVDTKMHIVHRFWRHFNFSLGLEGYVQTTWGSPSFTQGNQYSVNVLVDHSLPWKLSFQWNLGFVRAIDGEGDQVFVPTFQAALQWNFNDDLAIFLQSYRNAAALPRTTLARGVATGDERATLFGAGLQWAFRDRWALFGSFNVGFGSLAPQLSGSTGFAVSF
jgi:hypothetical protein